MKRQNLLILLIISLFAFTSKETKASISGGQITWECLPSGHYIFKMEIYTECTGTSFGFFNQIINYQGGSITMYPDSSRWMAYDGGNISPKGPTGCQRSCNNPPQLGATHFFPYVSDPITLNGTPPSGGWIFTWGPTCCRPPSVANLTSPASHAFTFRARMNAFQGRSANPCYDSSPKFNELPAVMVCKGNDFIYNHNASDNDLDSLVYSWAEPWDLANTSVNFAPGYSYDNPLPDTTFHPLNKAAVLNSQSGEMLFATHSGLSYQPFTTTINVDAYRNGIKIASIYRDLPFILVDCPTLPGIGLPNNPPTATVDSMPAMGFVDTVYAGEKVSFLFQGVETDSVYTDTLDPNTATLQQIYLSPSGFLFSNNFQDSLACKTSATAPCATLNPAPVLNSINGEYELSNQGTVSTTFEWQTTCDHLYRDSANGSLGRTYTFVMKTYDDHCDFPGVIYPSISVVVVPYMPAIQHNGNVLSTDTADSYQWFFNGTPIPNSDTGAINISSLGKYSVEVEKFGCTSQRADFQVMNVSLKKMDWRNEVKVYPNPFKDGFVVEVTELSTKDMSLTMLDINGKEVSVKTSVENKKIFINNTEGLPAGIYFIRLSSPEAEVYKKIIKL